MNEMKTMAVMFTAIVGLIAIMLLGSLGASRFVRWIGWPQDVLVALGMILFILAGIMIAGWRFGVMEHNQDERERLRKELNAKVRESGRGGHGVTSNGAIFYEGVARK